MKFLVTGCAGFVGSHVSELLLSRGDLVIGIDELNNYYPVSQKKENLDILGKFKGFKFYKTDIRDLKGLRKVFEKEKPDKIIHLAARAGVRASLKDPFLYEEVNIKGTMCLLELARDYHVRSFVMASTSSVYGEQKKAPFSEEDRTDRPVSIYSATKKAAEIICYTYHRLYGIKITCLRFFTVYGPRGRCDMAPYKFIKNVFEGKPIDSYGGNTKRDYTYVGDIAAGVVSAADKELDYEIINLGNSRPVTLNDFIKVVEKVTGKKAEIKDMGTQPGDVELTYADVRKAAKLLGYKPSTNIEEGMAKFADWYRKNRM